MQRWLPPVAAAGLVMAGSFKGVPPFSSFPFDLTLAFALLAVVVVVVHLARAPIPASVHLILLGFVVVVPAAFMSPVSDYATEKVVRFFTLTLLATLVPVLTIRDVRDAERHLWTWAAMCALVTLSAVVSPQQTGEYAGAPLTAEGNDTIVLGSAAGTVVIVLVLGVIWRRVPWLVALPLGAASLYALLQSGSRGPLLSMVLALVVGVFLVRSRPRPVRVVIILGLIALGVVVGFSAAPFYARQRIDELLGGEVVGTTRTRVDLWNVAITSVERHPFGIGWGNYDRIVFGGYQYPHNLALEVLCEAGVVCGGLFLLWIALSCWQVHRATGTYAGATAFAVLMFSIAGAATTGDINDNRTLFYALGIGLALAGLRSAELRRSTIPAPPDRRTAPDPRTATIDPVVP